MNQPINTMTPLVNVANYPSIPKPTDLGKSSVTTGGFITISSTPGTLAVKEFEILPLVKENDPILRTKADSFEFGKNSMFSASPRILIDPFYLAFSLFETMFAHKGIGLAAPQCGIPLQVIVVGTDHENKQVMFNPMIIQESPEKETRDEGCLSYPHLYVKVPRSTAIRVSYQDAKGVRQFQDFVGLTARAVQHEIDHIRGKLFFAEAGETSLAMARKRRKKYAKKAAK